MEFQIERNVTEAVFELESNGLVITLQPILVKNNNGGFDGIVNGGTP